MGQEIADQTFSADDFRRFRDRLRRETALLKRLGAEGRLSPVEGPVGYELEAWLVDGHGRPAPVNGAFLAAHGDPLITAELAAFNIEINAPPLSLVGEGLDVMAADLNTTLDKLTATGAPLGVDVALIGILPTVGENDLVPAHMSSMKRYRALNDQILALRQGNRFALDIEGRERLLMPQESVMLEAASTALQLQTQVAAENAGRYYDGAALISAATVALAANAPYLFGRDLWDESRIPLFEQAVAVRAPDAVTPATPARVTFGNGYLGEDVLSLFHENMERYHFLLPMVSDEPEERFCHLRLHNGAIWRWNRPLVGFDDDGAPHLRIEHRVMSSGPTVADTVAHAAFYFGFMARWVAGGGEAASVATFAQAKENFYAAARYGLEAEVSWRGKCQPLRHLLLDTLLTDAATGLALLGVEEKAVETWLTIIAHKAGTGQNGAAWQRGWVAKNGADFPRLVSTYIAHQKEGAPVSQWPL